MKSKKIIKDKGKKIKGVFINFTGLSLRKRLSIWWSFTKACLFKRITKTKYKVKEISL
jgi:hypothetical protein